MFQQSSWKAILVMCILLLVLIPASAMAATPGPDEPDQATLIQVDGSTTVYPIVSVGQYQYNNATCAISDPIYYTGSSHGQISVMNIFPSGINIDIGLSSSSCNSGNAFEPVGNAFTAAEYGTLTGTPSDYNCTTIVQAPIAQDALAVIVHPSRTCAVSLTKTQMQQIWEGNRTDPPTTYTWGQIFPGCAGQPFANNTLVPRFRIRESGTRDSFNSLNSFIRTTGIIYPNEERTANATGLPRMQGNSQTLQEIQGNPDQIGYTSLAFTAGVRSLELDCASYGSPAGCVGTDAPTKANVKDGSYPLKRTLRMFTKPGGLACATNFVTWVQSPQGQAVVSNVGYVENIADNQLPPNWDIFIDNIGDIGDVAVLGGDWNSDCPPDPSDPEYPIVRGCTRSDVSFDGTVDINDVSTFGACWNVQWGAGRPIVPGCWTTP
jgi:ABC-type phosphate transport system substrate-binding protein